MKRLYLLRHAKSDWDVSYGDDHARPLSARGRRAASTVGRFLASIGQQPQAVVTSSAVRARTTVELAASAGGWRCPVEVTDRLYGAAPETLLGVALAADDEVDRLLLAGHEPTWSSTVGRLIGGGDVRIVTAALARIDFSIATWADTRFGGGTLRWLVTPKILQRFGG